MAGFDVTAKTRELYRLLTEDFAAVVNDWLADEFVWINHLPEHIPFGGVYRGATGLGQYGKELAEAIELEPLHVDEIVVQGLTAVVIGVERGTHVLSTGKRYDMDWVHVVKYAPDGRLAYVREYNQYEGMAAAFRGSAATPPSGETRRRAADRTAPRRRPCAAPSCRDAPPGGRASG